MKIITKNIPSEFRNSKLKKDLLEVCSENDLIFMSIFGSYVRKMQNRNSDIDILIKYSKKSKRSLLDLIILEEKLSRLFKRKVDLLTIEGISPYLRNKILKTSKTIYER
jgi:hypothetical protein